MICECRSWKRARLLAVVSLIITNMFQSLNHVQVLHLISGVSSMYCRIYSIACDVWVMNHSRMIQFDHPTTAAILNTVSPELIYWQRREEGQRLERERVERRSWLCENCSATWRQSKPLKTLPPPLTPIPAIYSLKTPPSASSSSSLQELCRRRTGFTRRHTGRRGARRPFIQRRINDCRDEFIQSGSAPTTFNINSPHTYCQSMYMHKLNQQPAIMWSTWCGGCVFNRYNEVRRHWFSLRYEGKNTLFYVNKSQTSNSRKAATSSLQTSIGRKLFSMRGVKMAKWWQLLACDLMSFSACRFLTLRSSFHEATDILKAVTCWQQGGERCLRKALYNRWVRHCRLHYG